MGRWYQNGLTGAVVEVKNFDEEDALGGPPWFRCSPPPEAEKPKPAVKKPVSKKG